MELDPTRTAVIAVHLQKDVVNADGAFVASSPPRPSNATSSA